MHRERVAFLPSHSTTRGNQPGVLLKGTPFKSNVWEKKVGKQNEPVEGCTSEAWRWLAGEGTMALDSPSSGTFSIFNKNVPERKSLEITNIKPQ